MKALVAGGGIGGLSAALALARAGCSVEVVERAATIAEVGAGLQLSPNAMKGLAVLGVADDVVACGSTPETLELRLGASGRKIFSIPMGAAAIERYGAPYVHLHRADLIDILHAEAVKAGVRIRLGSELAAAKLEADRAIVGLESGDILEGDLLVGADGIHSRVRAQLFGEDLARFTGAYAWRCVVPGDTVPTLPHAAIVWAGPRRHAVAYRIRRGELINFVGVVEGVGWRQEGWSERGVVYEMRADFEGWDPLVREILAAAEQCWRWALYDRDPLPTWARGRATLLGDSCHAMPPFQAQGAAMAIEDAVVLSRCLAIDDNIEQAVLRYDGLRRPRAGRVLASARNNMGVFHRSNRLTQVLTYGPMALADRLLPEFVRSRQDWIYGYDPAAA